MKSLIKWIFPLFCIWPSNALAAMQQNTMDTAVSQATVSMDTTMIVDSGQVEWEIAIGMYYPWVKIGLSQSIAVDSGVLDEKGEFFYRTEKDSLVAVVFNLNTRVLIFEALEYKSVCEVFLEGDTSAAAAEGKTCPHQWDLKSVLLSELPRLQSLGVLKISEEAADSLARHIVELMEAALDDGADFEFLVYNHTEKTLEDKDTAYVQKTIIESVRSYFPELTGMRQNSKTAREIVKATPCGRGTFSLSGVKDGELFKAFDLNGVMLDRGRVRSGMVNVPKIPAVLEISGQRLLVR